MLANFAPGSGLVRRYTIFSADGGLGGSTFAGLNASNVPPSFLAGLSYDPNNVYLDLTAALGLGGALNQNQRNVAASINGFFNNGGALPAGFASLFGLTASNLPTALTLLSGEAATGAQQAATQLNSQFLNLMLDPWAYGRGGVFGAGSSVSPTAFSAEAIDGPLAYAAKRANALNEPRWPGGAPMAAMANEPRFSVWAGGYGGANRTQGDPVVIGSHDLTARTGDL